MIYLLVINTLLLLVVLIQRQITLWRLKKMSSTLDRIEKGAAALAEDVENVKKAVGELKTLVSDLQVQVASGTVDAARLDAAATKLEGIDSDLDSITNPPPATV